MPALRIPCPGQQATLFSHEDRAIPSADHLINASFPDITSSLSTLHFHQTTTLKAFPSELESFSLFRTRPCIRETYARKVVWIKVSTLSRKQKKWKRPGWRRLYQWSRLRAF